MAIKIADSVPEHVAQFLKASSELKLLQNAHLEYLAKINSTDTFPDSETIFIRAGITLLCSAWEAYVEDLARNGITFLIQNCKEHKDLPESVRRNIAKEIKQDRNELAPWMLQSRLDKILHEGRKILSQRVFAFGLREILEGKARNLG